MNFFVIPLMVILNGVMVYSVIKMRFEIKKLPNLFPQENLVAIHVLIFTAVNITWIVDKVSYFVYKHALDTYLSESTD